MLVNELMLLQQRNGPIPSRRCFEVSLPVGCFVLVKKSYSVSQIAFGGLARYRILGISGPASELKQSLLLFCIF